MAPIARKVPAHGKVARIPESLKPQPVSTKKAKTYTIPTKPIQPPKDLFDYIIFLYGLKGIGKTSLANLFPNAVTIMLEPRRRNIAIRQVPEPGAPQPDWWDVKGYLEAMIDKGNIRPVIDSLDLAYELCLAGICKQRKLDYPPETDYGRTWVEIREELASTFNQALYQEMPLTFISHAKLRQDEDFDDTPGEEGKYVAPTCAPQAWKYAKQVCDFAFYYGYYEGKHAMTVRGGTGIWASSGTEGNFLDPDGNPITTFYTGESPQAAYKALQDAFNNKLYDVAGPPKGPVKKISRK